MSEENEKKIITLLTELLKWNKFVAISALRNVALNTIKTDAEKIVFENSNGKLGSSEIGKMANVSHMTVVNYWKKWSALGLAVPSEHYQGRSKHICSLTELGIDVPAQVKVEVKQGEQNGNSGEATTSTS